MGNLLALAYSNFASNPKKPNEDEQGLCNPQIRNRPHKMTQRSKR